MLQTAGYTKDRDLFFAEHVEVIFSTARSNIHALLILMRNDVSDESLIHLFIANSRSTLIYAAPTWFSFANST